MKNVFLYLLLIMLVSCNGIDQKTELSGQKLIIISKTAPTEIFNQSFKKALNGYYALKDQFITEDSASIQSTANQFLIDLDSIKMKELKTDSAVIISAQSYIDGIGAEIKGLLGEKDLTSKRRSLQMISEQFFDLIQTVHYDQEQIYQVYCPMAFNNDGAIWLNNSVVIRNPYFPKKMLNCGELRDSIHFSKK